MASICLRTQGGFANRFRAIVSAVLWAEDLDRKLVIYWPVEPGHMACALGELLEVSSIPRLCCVHAGYLSKAHQVLSAADMQTVISLRSLGEDEIRIESYSEFHPELRKARGLAVFRAICVKGEIQAMADSLWASFTGVTTAIHFRGTDHKKCLLSSPLSAFLDLVRTGAGAGTGTEKYLLCTDEPEVASQFLEEFGPLQIVVPVSVRGRRLASQQIQGVVDWLLLQKCSRILGSAGSSFSETAALRSGASLLPVLTLKP